MSDWVSCWGGRKTINIDWQAKTTKAAKIWQENRRLDSSCDAQKDPRWWRSNWEATRKETADEDEDLYTAVVLHNTKFENYSSILLFENLKRDDFENEENDSCFMRFLFFSLFLFMRRSRVSILGSRFPLFIRLLALVTWWRSRDHFLLPCDTREEKRKRRVNGFTSSGSLLE